MLTRVLAVIAVGMGVALASAQTPDPATVALGEQATPGRTINTFDFLPQINKRQSVVLRAITHKMRDPLPHTEPNTLPVGGMLNEERGNLLSRFPAIGFTGFRPPDPDLGVGPNHIVAVVNSSLAFYTKAGNQDFQQDFETFFQTFFPQGGSFLFDPKVHYDRHAGRFVVIVLDFDASTQRSRVLLAVSDDNNPNGNWHQYAIDVKTTVSGSVCWGDYPGFGYNKDGYVVALNLFTFAGDAFRGVRLTTIRKSSVLNGGTAATTAFVNTAGDSFSLQAAEVFDAAVSKMYLMNTASTSQIKIWTLDGLDGTPAAPTTQNVTVPSFVFPPATGAPSSGGRLLDELDGRLINVAYRGAKLLTVHAVQATTDSRNRIRWYEFTQPLAAAATLAQSGEVIEPTTANNHFHMGAISKNAAGDIGLIFTRSGTNIVADIMRTARKASDPVGTMGNPVLVQGSVGPTYGFSAQVNRWGDYAGLRVDPNDDATFWGIHMNGDTGTLWKTEVFSFAVTPTLASLTFSSDQAFGGGASPVGTVKLSAPATAVTAVALSSNNTSLLTVPASTTFSVGQDTRTFTCGMVGGVNVNTPVTVTASLAGVNKPAVITLLPANLTGFTLAATTLTANNVTTGTLTLGGKAGPSGRAVTVTSSNAIAYSLSPITVPANANSTTFTIFTRNTLVTQVANISATLGTTITRQLTVIMPPPLVAFTINPTTIKGGSPVWSTARIQLAAPTSGVLIRYVETSPNVIMPSSALIPQGGDRVNVQILTTAVVSTQVVTIDARLNGVIKAQTLTITP